jgi:CzcA family heavy metal efflux pump
MNRVLVAFSIRHPGAVVVLAGLVLFYGLYRLALTPLDVFPEFSPAQVVIQTEAPGFSAELVEEQVTRPIEAALGGVNGVELMRSQSIPGLAVITLGFTEASDLYRNRQMVAERLGLLAGHLPLGITPTITPLTSSASTVLGVGLSSKTRNLFDLRAFTDHVVRPHLMAVTGVADVNVFGGKVRQWQVQMQPERMAQHRVTAGEVVAAAQAATTRLGAGFIEGNNQRVILTSDANPANPAQLGAALVAMRDGVPVSLGMVADLAEGAAPSISAAGIDGDAGVFLLVQGQFGANTMAVTRAVETALAELHTLAAREQIELHPGMFRPANFIETALANVRSDVLIGSVLVVLVLFLFLFDVRTALISTAAIPMSLLAAIIVLSHFGVPVNVMVIGGLAIALGEVVDDAIIDSENIFRRLRENRAAAAPRPIAAVVFDASMEVRASVVFATFIVVLVFIPLLTLSGIAGKLFAPLGFAYIAAILASLLVALTLTPALCYLLLARARLRPGDPPLIGYLKRVYLRLLGVIELRPYSVMIVTALCLSAGIGALPLIGGEFLPQLREGHYVLHMSAVPGTSEQESLRVGSRVAREVLRIDGVKSVAQWVGRAENGADTFGTHYSEFEVEVGPLSGEEQQRILDEMRRRLAGVPGVEFDFAAYPGINFGVNTFLTERIEETVTGYTAQIAVNIFGADLDQLDRDAQAVAQVLAAVPGSAEVQIQAPPGAPELSLRFDQERLARAGISAAEALLAVQASYAGVEVGRVFEAGRPVPVSVTLAPRQRAELNEVANLTIRGAGGRIVRLGEVASIEQRQGRYKILHAGGKRLQSVTCNVRGRDLGDFNRDLRERLGALKLSPGTYLSFSGAAEEQARARGELLTHALLAGTGVLVLLYIAFGSLANLSVTIANLPFALIGGIAAVLLTSRWISLGSLVGFVTLFGITLRNSIMLVSHYQHLVQVEGRIWNAATALHGAAERLPSILMTAIVTALGLLPLALGSGQPGREIEGPMAQIIVGGLVSSTVLNLLILPTMLLHFGRFRRVAN